ncbi:MAG TPA: Stp1/IreP family PP2C-type Ser/Thr phosphatase [Ktedonobacterales bacterium]|nr:Stp1/IreP family PP2C-type Ser/Thr phosphatase [Ktedonobacterales bacterium]
MTSQLRLAYGILTDVGQKRERNQDNVTSHVPQEANELEERGALFVVCDGMGGHAAGEVAAELGVRTIREVYFASQGQDVITSIAQAVKAANDAIYALARSHSEYSGMGTTCVTLVISGGRAYIVNIGDSRAYIIRDGQMRQVTQDHSWVAEQVRIGLLTEEQARVHAHRNVITRSLGTQPNITADLFVETLRPGDRVLLCSDGLHGYVEEAAISQEVTTQPSPEAATRNLIDMANANGGPDNISAILVEVLETPDVTGPIPLPPNVAEPIEEGTTQPLPVPPGMAPAAASAAAASAATSVAASPTTGASPASPAEKSPARRNRRGLLALRLLEIAALLLVLFTGWYVGFGPLATQRATNQQAQDNLNTARRILQQANGQTPTSALKSLAQARTLALTDVNNPSLDPSVKTQAQSFLDQELVPAVQQALQRYNSAALITPAPVASAISYTLNCVAPGQTAPAPVTAVSGLVPVSAAAGKPALVAGQQVVFFVNGGSLYEALIPVDANNAPTAGATICVPVTVKGVGAYLSVAGDGDTVYALASQTAGGYSVVSVTPTGLTSGAPTSKSATLFTMPVAQETPTHLAVAGKSLYVSYAGGATTPYGVWFFNGQPKTPGGSLSPAQTIALPAAAASLLAANNTVYMLLADGTLGQLDVAHLYTLLPVIASTPATTTDPATYTAATPVPTPQSPTLTPTTAPTATTAPATTGTVSATPATTPSSTPTVGTTFSQGARLAADPLAPTNLLLSDPANNRIIRLVTSSSGPGVGVVEQYVYGAPITNVGDVAMTGAGSTLNAYLWSDTHLATVSLPEPPSGN